jgi:hypothetical protein
MSFNGGVMDTGVVARGRVFAIKSGKVRIASDGTVTPLLECPVPVRIGDIVVIAFFEGGEGVVLSVLGDGNG